MSLLFIVLVYIRRPSPHSAPTSLPLADTMVCMHTVKRLITEFIPKHYKLSIAIDRIGRNFTGVATITGDVIGNKIMLHAHELTITSVTVDGKAIEWLLGQDDELTIANSDLKAGEHVVTIDYSGQITDQLHGLYPCRYELNGESKEILATQFESHYARNVFPCVDEPAAKATFDLALTTETGVTALSNMPIKSQTEQSGKLATAFETTPKMSTYLLAFVVGEFQSKNGKTKDGVDVTVYATPAQNANSLDFALKHSIDTIEFFNDYFGVPYPLPKSDQVALPDFANGAMENWGLVTYRESALLYDPAVTSIASKQYIATVISHELSHQWFGNLVTMAWWDDLWLNESFATIMEYVCVDAIYPEWNVWLDFNLNEAVYAMRRDSLAGVQSVKIDVNHPDEIQSVFDGAIVYAKGACLLRMMREFVGEDAFRQGLADYFKQHAYANTKGSDLWNALQKTSGKDVGAFMNQWLTQNGFPLVSAQLDGNNVTLTQKQFVIGPNDEPKKLWPIPLSNSLFTEESTTVTKGNGVFKLNSNDTSYCISKYDNVLSRAILDHISSGQANVTERAQLLKEQALLAKSPELATATLVGLISAYTTETDEKVWGMLSGVIGDLKRFVDPNTPAEAALKSIARKLAMPMYKKLGWDAQPNESEDDTMLRSTIIGTMLYGEDPEVIAEARKRYAEQPLNQMDSELRDLILIAEVRHGDTVAAIDNLLDQYKASSSVDIKNSICDGVTATDNTAQIERLIALLKDTKTIRTQDTAMWFVRLLNNRHARTAAWQWLQTEWSWVDQTFGGDKSYDAFPRYSASILATREQLNEYIAFFTPKLTDTAIKRAINVGINDITARVELLEADKAAVEQKLSSFRA